MHASTLILLVLLALILGGLSLGAYLVAADKLYSKDKRLTAPRRKPAANPGIEGRNPEASSPGQAEPRAEDKRP